MIARLEVWTLGAGPAAEVSPGVLVRKCATRDFGRKVREAVDGRPEGAASGIWGWIREDGRPGPGVLLGRWPGAVVDLELATWPGSFTEADAAELAGAGGVTSHGYPVGRHLPGLRVLGAAGLPAYPQLYRPGRPTVTPAKFAEIALGKWQAAGFGAVVPLVAAGDGAYALEVGAAALRAGAAGVALWGWTSSPSRSTCGLLARLHRLAYPV